ncbi:MAG: ferritin-like domain-containing protein [Myxococcota bacterium]
MPNLSAEERRVVALTWSTRAISEARAAAGFEGILRYLETRNAPTPLRQLAATAIDDERRHAERCRQLAIQFGAPPDPLPKFSPTTATLTSLLGSCCVGETLGAAFLDRVRRDATDSRVESVARELLKDEITHGRLGWAVAASLTPAERNALSLVDLLEASLDPWRARLTELPTPAVPTHGCHSAADISELAHEALHTLVLPGFAHVGFDVTAAETWAQTAQI